MGIETALLGAVGYNVHSGQQAAKAQSNAQRDALDASQKQAALAEQATNRANQKRPDISAILSAAQMAGRAGASGTLLTGPGGVNPSALSLGKNTLLGQ